MYLWGKKKDNIHCIWKVRYLFFGRRLLAFFFSGDEKCFLKGMGTGSLIDSILYMIHD